MSNDDFNFSMPLGARTHARDGGDDARYLAPPFDARVAEPGQALLLIHGETRLQRLPLQLVQVFGQCNRLRTLEQHVHEISRALRLPPQQVGAVRQSLEELVRRRLLRTEADILEQLEQDDARRPEPSSGAITHLFIRTCARPGTLDRLLNSLGRRGLPEGLEHVVVLDDDTAPGGRRATRSVVEAHRGSFPGELTLLDPEDRRAVLERLARGAGSDPEHLRWYVEGDSDDPEPSYGASLNFALLLGAGRLIAMVDDDATLEAFELPDTDRRPAFGRRQSARLHFPEPGLDLRDGQYPALDAHPVDLHAELLGLTTATLAESAGSEPGGLLEDLDPQLLSELSGPGRVRLTSSGTLGDPGTGGLQWLFAERPEHLKPLCESEERYRSLLEQRRMARSAGRPEITTAFALMTTTMTGIDNRELLLPTQPRGANEDLLFGALVGFLHPGSLQAGLPHMLFHMRPEPRRWQAADLDRPRGINRGGFLAARLHSLRSTASGRDAASRARMLVESFRDMARAEPDDLAWQLTQELLEVRAQTIEQATALRERLAPPPWLDRDFARVIAQHSHFDQEQEERIGALGAGLPRFLERYADALGDWIETWHYCSGAGIDIDQLLEKRA